MQSLLFKWFLGFYWVRHHSEQTAPFTSALRVRWHGNDCPSLNYTHDSRTQNVTPCMNMLTAVHVPLFSLSLSLVRFQEFPSVTLLWTEANTKGQPSLSISFSRSFFLSFSFSPLSFHHQHAKLYSPFFFKSFSATAIILEHDITMTFIVCSCRLIGSFESKRLHFFGTEPQTWTQNGCPISPHIHLGSQT